MIKEAFKGLPRDIVKAAGTRFRSQIVTVVDTKRGFFE